MDFSSSFEARIAAQAKTLGRKVCLPEAQFDARVLRAACLARENGWLIPVMVGDTTAIKDLAGREGLDIDGIQIADPANSPELETFAAEYVGLRQGKERLTKDDALSILSNPSFYGAMLVRHGVVDGLCSGAYLSTADVLRPCLRIVGLKPGVKTVFAMGPIAIRECALGRDIALFTVDCAIVPQPTSEQLAEFTIESADVVAGLTGEPARAALLSFSTLGSASHPEVEKVRAALEIVRARRPDISVDGEFQLDTAVVEAVGKRKAPASAVAGTANLLVFPNLDAANMTAKAIQWFGGGRLLATMILGLNGRINDHTRGASVEEIAMNMALTAVRVP